MKYISFLLPLSILTSCTKEKEIVIKQGYIDRTFSRPNDKAIILIDFNGSKVDYNVWEIDSVENAGIGQDSQSLAFDTVVQDFRMFPVTITTNEQTFLKSPLKLKIRAIVTTTYSFSPEMGGVAMQGSIGMNIDCFIFSPNVSYSPRLIGHTIAHEVGHIMGLRHQTEPSSIMSKVYSERKVWVRGYDERGSMQDDETIIYNALNN
jgi:hypothetical protein